MVELTDVQAIALRTLVGRTASFLKTVECANGPTAAVRDSIIEDCENWRRILMERMDARPSHQEVEGR